MFRLDNLRKKGVKIQEVQPVFTLRPAVKVTDINSYQRRFILSTCLIFFLPSMLQACLESSLVTGYIWPSNGKFLPSRRGRTPRRTAWLSSRWALCATSTLSSPSQSCHASSWWGTAWRSSGSPTEVSGRGGAQRIQLKQSMSEQFLEWNEQRSSETNSKVSAVITEVCFNAVEFIKPLQILLWKPTFKSNINR